MVALTSIYDVGERHISNAHRFWWAYRIANEWHLDPREVKRWNADEVLEALAAIGLAEQEIKKNQPSTKGG